MIKQMVTEFWRLFFTLLLGLMFGMLVGAPGLWMLLAALGFFIWHAYQLFRFGRWLSRSKKKVIPDVGGIWGELYYQIQRLRERNKKSKKRLANYLARFQESTAALPDSVIVLREDITIEWFNDSARKLLNLHRSKDTGQRIDNLIRYPEFIKYLNGGDYSEPLQLRSPLHDEQVLQLYIVPYGVNQRLVVVRDITHLNRLEQMRRDFVANVSHELGTPLTVISGYLETLINDAGAGSLGIAEQNALQEAQSQVDRMKHIVSDLLLLSRLEASENASRREQINVSAMVEELSRQIHGLIGFDHRIKLHIQEDLHLKGSEHEIYSAFTNLLTNAVKYTPANGQIDISWSIKANGEAVFEVKDTGVGIARQFLPRLTERFFRVDEGRSRGQGGTGLGLAIVKHVLHRHQARLEIDSELGKGSCFRCIFPAERALLIPLREKTGS